MTVDARRWLAALVLSCAALARADLFSPGDLSKAHSTLDGLSQCTKCHPAGGQLSQDTCLECHGELQPRLSKGLGLHGKIPAGDKRNCEHCHHEHQGENASILDWGPGGEKGFNHLRTGWALKGAHQEAKCTACHEKRRVLWPTAQKLLEKRPHTKLGLGNGCPDCHFDEHRGQQKEDCEYCHTEKDWKAAPGFNHDDTSYPLRGKHRKVKCTGCHDTEKDGEAHGFPAPKSETFLRFAPLDFKSCLDCHKDPHEGRFGLRCQSCHTVDGWNILRNATKEREFHQKTKFPLKGAHVDVDCVACHGPWPGQKAKFKGLAFDTCASCHPDAHEGQLGRGPGGKALDCDACHTEQGFKPAKYGLPEHAKTKYPLDGAHQVVPCANCHPATPSLKARVPKTVLADLKRKKRDELFSFALFEFNKPTERCESCHADEHDGQFKQGASQGRCDACHEVASFTKLRFDHQRDSQFPLEGAHAKVKCAQCHFAPSPAAAVVYRPLAKDCASCHADAHAGQFKAEKRACESCHRTTKWSELEFRHAPPFTDFLLDGQHAKAKCESCHRKVQVGPKVSVAQYRPLPKTCEGCHADFHKGAFKGFEP
ncbi:MAG: hypothetical protein ACOZQL_23025 [Myxococcota bacterium]